MACVRFAPSPTGVLHVGNARVALMNWLYARKQGADFILRLDDTDDQRSCQEYVEGIIHDLSWLGLTWSEMVRQSERLDLYRAAFDRLRACGRIYACYETPEELALMRKRLLAQGKPPIYDRSGLGLTEDQRSRLEDEGRRPHWRFFLDDRPVAWDDLVHGTIRFDKLSLSDPVLYRSDGRPLFTLPSVVDDIDLSISLVARGDDHIANTAVQIGLFKALEAEPPRFAHLPLLTASDGGDLSKRRGGALSLQELAVQGFEPMAINAHLVSLGSTIQPENSLEGMAAGFDFSSFSKASARFSMQEIMRFNRRIIQDMPFDEARPRLVALGVGAADESFWLAVRPNLERFADVETWWQVCCGTITPQSTDGDYLALALDILPCEPWDDKTWGLWTATLQEQTGRRGKALFHPLRLALTGMDHGPGLNALLPLMGRDRAVARLRGQAG